MTSNIGTRQLKEFGRGVGFAAQARTDDNEYSRSVIQKALNKTFAPEFLNRLDEIITFDQLSLDAITKIVDIELKGLYERIEAIGYKMVVQEEHILHGEVELGGAVCFLGQMNHFLRGVRCLDLLRGVYDVTCDKPRAGGQLQHGFVPDSGADQLIHLLIGGHVPAQKAVIVRRVLVPKI